MKKNYTSKRVYLLAGAVAIAACNCTTAFGYSAASIEAGASGATVTYSSYNSPGGTPVVTALLSQVGMFGGHNYTSWSFLVADSTGSLDIFASSSATALAGYTPTVGDGINVVGKYSPFDQIPEIETPITSFSKVSSGNPVPAPLVTTIPTVNVPTLPFSVAGYFLQLNDVTIGGSGGVGGLFPTYAQATTATETFTVTDSANNSMTLFDWVTSYSTDGAMGGTAVPTGPVNIDGFVDVFGTGTAASAEFVPMVITSVVPEPDALKLCGEGLLVAALYVFRKKA